MSSIDWKKESQGGTRFDGPEGTYKVEIDGWQACEARTGTPQIRWFGKIVDPDEYKGQSLVDHTALSSAALWRLAKFVNACGIDISNAPTMEIMSDAFKRVLDKCCHRMSWWTVTNDPQYGKKVTDNVPVAVSEQPTLALGADEGGDDTPQWVKE